MRFAEDDWRPFPEFEELYEINFRGDVRNRRTKRMLKIRNLGKPGQERPAVVLTRGKKQYGRHVARSLLWAFVSPPPTSEHHAAHEDGDHLNNDIGNLSWKTPVENNADKLRHGTHLFGEKHPAVRLRELDVVEIRSLKRGPGWPTYGDLAAKYGVSRMTIRDIIKRRTWGHI